MRGVHIKYLGILFFILFVFFFYQSLAQEPAPRIEPQPRLEGLRPSAVVARMGQPSSRQVSYDFDKRVETWHYPFLNKPDVYVVFVDGYVKDISYR